MLRCAACAVLLLAVTGCQSTITGNEGNLEFSYAADEQYRDFNKAIAVGAKLDLAVRVAGTHESVEIVEASTDNEQVLKVVGKMGYQFTVQGIGEGSALITVKVKSASGETLTDSVSMHTRVPDTLKISHTCTAESEAFYLTDHDIVLPFDMLEDNEPVIGYGYFPATIAPDGALQIDQTSKDQQFLHLRSASVATTATMTSTVDSAHLTFRIVAPAEISGAAFYSTQQPDTNIGSTVTYHVLPVVGAKPVCQAQTPMQATSLTPDICQVSASATGNTDNEHGWILVTGKAAGRCDFSVSFSQGANGAGASTTLSVQIVPQQP
jgi:hypothetical protein